MESNRGCLPVRPLLRSPHTLLRSPHTLTAAKSATDLLGDPSKSMVGVGVRNFEKYEVIVESEQLQGELRSIEWRCKTELPVVKVLFYKVLQRKLLGECAVVQVAIEAFPHNLASLPPLPLPHILYLLKEALVGFERLLDRFGSFDPSARMVLINRHGKCRVWINENITLNFPARRAKLTEATFLAKLASLFQEKTLRTPAAHEFFQRITNSERFVQALHTLEAFVRNSKIVLPGKLSMNAEGNHPLKNAEKREGEEGTKEEGKQEVMGCGSLKKIPKFILQLREERKQDEAQSKSFDSPKKQPPRDRSCAKTTTHNKPKQSELGSDDKSSHSPLSHISQTKSNNVGRGDGLRPAVRELLKQNSHQAINTYATMVPISTPLYSLTEKHLPAPSPLNHPQRPQKKQRKLSNEESPSKLIFHPGMPIVKISPAEQCSVLCSQQTAATFNEGSSLFKLMKHPTEVSRTPPKEETCIYQKNGWLKRMNTLTGDTLRDTMQSQYEGQETFSEEYLLAGQQLGVLGSMGRQLKGSVDQDNS